MKLKILAVVTVVLVTTSGFAQDAPVSASRRMGRPLHMLVLGDSILWGQGLKPEHKSWHLVKVWLETNTGRPVVERIQAHSGAVIERASLTDNLSSTNSEVNLGLPTSHNKAAASAIR